MQLNFDPPEPILANLRVKDVRITGPDKADFLVECPECHKSWTLTARLKDGLWYLHAPEILVTPIAKHLIECLNLGG